MRVGPRRTEIREGSSEDVDIAIAGTVTVYSKSLDLSNGTNFAIEILAAGTTVNLQIQLEQSSVKPDTEGSADTDEWSVPSGASDIIDGLTQKTHFCKSISPITTQYARLKIIGKSGNTSDVTIKAWLVKLEDI